MVVVVLGMHRTGTSLVANLLHNAMGVHMGSTMLGAGAGNPWGVWEDKDFFSLNRQILAFAAGAKGDHWRNPPPRASVLAAEPKVRRKIAQLIRRKEKRERWGWKDPRNCLTIELYYPYLKNPFFIVTERSQDAVIASLERRSSGPKGKAGADYWVPIIRRYENDRDRFLKETGAPHIRLQFEKLVTRPHYYREAARLASFLGLRVRRTAIKKVVHCRN